MATRRTLKAVLHNFVGTFTSRYSEYDRYWLLGFLVSDPRPMNLELLTADPDESGETPAGTAAKLAVTKFHDQLAKHGLDASLVRSAQLVIERPPEWVEGQVDSRLCWGYMVRVTARAVSDRGRAYESERILFVAPHDPRVERQSAGDRPPSAED